MNDSHGEQETRRLSDSAEDNEHWQKVKSLFTWIFYIALEPFVRRRWLELIISWSRLMAGDFRDPLVWRDVPVGGLWVLPIRLGNI